MDREAYLRRIDYEGPREPTLAVLPRLHRAHLRAVPFENLDIPLGRPIRLTPREMFDKVVRRRRGGFCYELNGLFALLLEDLGFRSRLLSARVHDDGTPGPEFDHLLLLAELGGGWIVDVGFGDSFLEPMPLGPGEQIQGGRSYRLTEGEGEWTLGRRDRGGRWEAQYSFTLRPRRLEEFEPMCRYHQTSPESSFTRKSVCSRATEDGRVTLSNGRLIRTGGGKRWERVVQDAEEYRVLLEAHFGVTLPPDADVGALLGSSGASGRPEAGTPPAPVD